jgi:putative effector of murein hydrolase LrgA (UPF0299 family)
MANKKTQHTTQLMYLAILALTLFLIPVLVGVIQHNSFNLGFAAGMEQSK